jgi:5-formyltetrahydrofolate cyclo-ligase
LLLGFESNGSHRHMRVTLSNSPFGAQRARLRAQLRARRRALTPAERAAAAQGVARNIDRYLGLRAGDRVALYASLQEELDTRPLLALARRRGWRIYTPRIDRARLGRKMRFVAAGGEERMNRLGISEPQAIHTIGARWLDLVFVPLVAFDAHGMRLGMGGGFYDRAFSFRRWRRAWRGPRLVGIAYSFQELPEILPAAHDVRLDFIVTEKGLIKCATGS